MIRLLIFIITLNAFMVPAVAEGTCGAMDESNAMMMSSSTMNAISDMSCEMSDGTICSSIQCISSCAVSIIPLAHSGQILLLNVAGYSQFQTGLAYYYTLILPVNTPPPLV